jgi:hypothetical protein
VHARPDLHRRRAKVLEPERDLVLDTAEDDLILGILEQRGDLVREIRWAETARVASGHLDPPLEPAAVEVRNEPGQGAEERRLAGARRAEERDDLARFDPERDVAERRPLHTGIRERQPFDLG